MNILEVVNDQQLFAPWFRGDSWEAWRAFLAACFGLPPTAEQEAIFRQCTGRQEWPTMPAREAWLPVGRRGGKSLVAATCAVYAACFKDYSQFLAPGEVATVMVIASDKRQARVVMRYIAGYLDNVLMLSGMVTRRTQETIELSNRTVIEVHVCSFRTVRGYSLAGVICDEIAFWRSEDSANPDSEILAGLRPGMATIPGALLLCISSPYARRGALWDAHRKHYGKKDDPVLLWQASTSTMNPTVDPGVIEQALEEDESSAKAEYYAEFRRDIETYISREMVDSVIIPGRAELPYVWTQRYSGFVDPSGGSQDSMTLAISHKEKERVILDCIREKRPPFSPEAVVKEFAEILMAYRVSKVTGDRYAGEWPREQFRKCGITYEVSEKTKSEIYRDLLPVICSEKVELLDNPRLISQLCNLERRTARGGRDSVDHGPGGHDDLINAAAGALVGATPALIGGLRRVTGF